MLSPKSRTATSGGCSACSPLDAFLARHQTRLPNLLSSLNSRKSLYALHPPLLSNPLRDVRTLLQGLLLGLGRNALHLPRFLTLRPLQHAEERTCMKTYKSWRKLHPMMIPPCA